MGWVTFREVLRQKLLYNILLLAALLFGLSFLASHMTFIGPDRVVMDFGIAAMNLSGAAIAILMGSALINREFERRTIFVALSHPISRFQFLFGKYLGLAGILVLNWLLFSGLLAWIIWSAGGSADFTPTYFCAIFFLLLEALVLEAIAVFFSTFTTTALAAVLSIGVYLVGNNISQLRLLATRLLKDDAFAAGALNAVAAVFPNLENFNLSFKVTYGLPVARDSVYMTISYAAAAILFALLLAGLTIERREG